MSCNGWQRINLSVLLCFAATPPGLFFLSALCSLSLSLLVSPLCHTALSLNAFCLCLRFTSNFYATLNIYIVKKIVKNLTESAREGALKEASVAGLSSSCTPSPFVHSSLIMLSEVWLDQAQANYRDWYSVAAHTAEISLSQSFAF